MKFLRSGALFMLFLISTNGQVYKGVCDQPKNVNRQFCDSTLSIDARVEDLISSLSIDELINISRNNAGSIDGLIELLPYNYWGEALHGVAYNSQGSTYFRPPTEYATAFPQIINLASSFNKELFFQMGNAIGNEARAFYNVGNSGLTYWSPNVNIYRDPRWGRGHETPGEDPYLNGEYARLFVQGMQENDNPFLKNSACCKHFAAHSQEEGRDSFNSIVTAQDMADTYLPAFKTCVQDGHASCVMCSYNAINGIPACADRNLLTVILRENWGFDGYIVTDCGAVDWMQNSHKYTNTSSETCRVVYEAGVDVACDQFLYNNLQEAISDGNVTRAMMETALGRGFRVLMRSGYFEKDEVRPYKELQPPLVDSQSHRAMALDAARQSIVLLKNGQSGKSSSLSMPVDLNVFKSRRASMALIGPHLNASHVFLGNYYGFPSFIKTPLEEIQKRVADLEYEFGCELSSIENERLQEAEDLARLSDQVVLFVGISSAEEDEYYDRVNLSLPGLQNELIRRVLSAVQQPVILVVVSGGPIDLSEWKSDARVGAIIYAGYLGQAGGEAIADVIFGTYNPSGRLAHTFYSNDYLSEVEKSDMNVRPRPGYPGRTYRFYTGTPVYEFGFGLSYTTFQYSWTPERESPIVLNHSTAQAVDECDVRIDIIVENVGSSTGDHSVLAYLSPPNAGQMGRTIKNLAAFEKINNMQPNESRQLEICLSLEKFHLANEEGEFEAVTGEWKLIVGNIERSLIVL